jgi:hypothetical protein
MVELSRSFTRDRLQRQPQAATLSGVPGLPRIPDDSGAMAQASATFAQGLQSLGKALGQIAERDAQLQRADDVAKAGQAVGQFSLGMATVQQGLVDSNVPALDRPQALRTGGEELMATLVGNVPQRAQERFKAEATQQLARMVLAEQSTAAQQFVSEQKAALPAILALVGRQLVTADARQRPGIEASLTAISSSFAQAGIFGAADAQALTTKVIEEASIRRAQREIASNPQAAAAHLQALARGETGTAGMESPPPAAVPQLLDQAQSQVQQPLQWADAAERRIDKAVRDTQDGVYVAMRGDLMRLDPIATNAEAFRAQLADAEQKFKDGKISKEHYDQLSSQGRAMLDRALAPSPPQDDVGFERDITVRLAQAQTPDTLQAVRTALLEGAGRLRPETISRLNGLIESRLDASHYSNTREYRDGVDIILRAAIVPGQLLPLAGMEAAAREETQRNLTLALDAYEEQMSTMARRSVPEMKAQARDLAYRLRGTFFPSTPNQLPPVLRDLPTEEALRQKLEQMKTDGVPESQLQRFRDQWRQMDADRREEETRKKTAPPTGRRQR